MKYEFRINGIAFSINALYKLGLHDTLLPQQINELLLGRKIKLPDFITDGNIDILQLLEVK